MEVKDIMQYLESIEKRYPVNHWKINDICIWPVVRFFIYFRLYDLLGETNSKPTERSFLRKYLKHFSQLIKLLLVSTFGLLQSQRISNKYDTIILDDGVSYDKYGLFYYDKFCDPLQKTLSVAKNKTLRLSIAKTLFFPRFSKQRQIRLSLYLYRLFKKPMYTYKLDGLEELNNELNSKFPNFDTNVIDIAKKRFSNIQANYLYFLDILTTVKPKFVYMVCYYNDIGMAMCLAARRLKVPTTDVQHGVQGKGHVAYYGWSNIPKNGYELIPDNYACWSENEIRDIGDWATGTRYSGYVLGNLYLEELIASGYKNDQFEKHFRYVNESLKPKYHVLLTLQYSFNITREISEIIKNFANGRIFFWIRMHPTCLEQIDEVKDEIHKLKNDYFEISITSKAPLYTLLPHMHAHVTLNSSVVIEASHFNIPSLVLDKTGEFYYSSYIASGAAIYDEPTAGFKKLLKLINKI